MDTCRFGIFHCLAEFKFLQLCPFLQQECGTIKYEISFAWKRHGRQGWLILEHICGILTITNDHSTTSTGNIIIILLAFPSIFLYATLYKNRRVDLGQKSVPFGVSLSVRKAQKKNSLPSAEILFLCGLITHASAI